MTAEERAEILAEIDEIRARAVRRLEMSLIDVDRRLEWLQLGRMEIGRLERLLEREG